MHQNSITKHLSKYKGRTVAQLMFVMYVLLLITVSLVSTPNVGIDTGHLDKVVHCMMYLMFVLIGWYAFPSRVLYVVILSVLLGIAIEYCQGVMKTNRHSDFVDIIFNIIGSLIGINLIVLFSRKRDKV